MLGEEHHGPDAGEKRSVTALIIGQRLHQAVADSGEEILAR